MAMSTDKKLYIAAGVLAILGLIVWTQKRSERNEAARYSLNAASANLPKLNITEDQTKNVDKIVIEQPPGDAGKPEKIVLEKKDDAWSLVEPIKAKANQKNVESLLNNLKELHVSEQISDKPDAYALYDLNDDKAIRLTVQQGVKTLLELHIGQGGTRGQMVRVGDKTGVFALKGYSSYLYTRALKGWRDLEIFKFDDKEVASVDVKNEFGEMEFTRPAAENAKGGDKDASASPPSTWSIKFHKARGGIVPVKRFDSAKADDLVRAYKSLTALDFARDKEPKDVGLDKPEAEVTFTLKDGAKKTLHIGNKGDSSNRWVLADGDPQIYSISSYAADWVTSDISKYEKPEDKKKASASKKP